MSLCAVRCSILWCCCRLCFLLRLLPRLSASGGRRAVLGRREALLAFPAFGIGWFFISLLVESSVIPIRDVMFEHRLYLPSVGLGTGLAAVAGYLQTGWANSDGCAGRRPCGSAGMVLMLLGTMTLRNRVWHDEVTLWQDVVRKVPERPVPTGSRPCLPAFRASG